MFALPAAAANWERSIDGTGTDGDGGRAVVLDAQGNAIAGGFQHQALLDSRFTVVKVDAGTGAESWRTVLSNVSGGNFGAATSVALDPVGDVVAAGTSNDDDITIVKLRPTDGGIVWRSDLQGQFLPVRQHVRAMATDAAGDIIVAGDTTSADGSLAFLVVKVRGSDGAELWRYAIDGTAGLDDFASGVGIAPNGDVLAIGMLENGSQDVVAVRLRGADGAELWRRLITDPNNQVLAEAMAVTSTGDLILAGSRGGNNGGAHFGVSKLAGVDGHDVWATSVGSGIAFAVAVDASDNVFAGGLLGPGAAVVKLAAASGAVVWNAATTSLVSAVTMDGIGHVVAVGYATRPVGQPIGLDLMAIQLDASTGAQLWRLIADGTDHVAVANTAQAVATDAAGNPTIVGSMTNLGTNSDFAILRASVADGTEIWRHSIAGAQIAADDAVQAIALSGTGDEVEVGFTENVGTGNDLTVARLRGSDGGELWRVTLNGTRGARDAAQAVAIDAADDVLVAGALDQTSTGSDLIVLKLRGSDGTELWRYVLDGAAHGDDEAIGLALDSNGNPVVVGAVVGVGTGRDFAVVKLAGTTGAELWHQTIDGSAHGDDEARALAIQPAGDVVVAGTVGDATSAAELTVARLAAADGTIQWRTDLHGEAGAGSDAGRAVAIDSAGDVIAAGVLATAATGADLAVVKLHGATGAEAWRYRANGSLNAADQANALALEPTGDAIVAGLIRNGTPSDFAVVRLAGATGAEVWRTAPNAPNIFQEDMATSVAVDHFGDVVAAGRLAGFFGVLKLAAGDGSELWRRQYGASNSIGIANGVAVDSSDDVIAGGAIYNAIGSEQTLDFSSVKIALCGNGVRESAEECDSGACCTNACRFADAAIVCRPTQGACDAPETCSGASAACPPDGFLPSSTLCRGAAGECDVAENCPGSGPNCPADQKASSGTSCSDDGNPCSLDQCDGSSVVCQHPAGHAGATCRASAGECDVGETCTGTSTSCPADVKQPSGTPCSDDGNPCSLDQCNGASAVCQHPAGHAGAVCRPSAGDCDVAEACTGASTACPADLFKPSSFECRATTGECDPAEHCTGAGASCPANDFTPSGTSCADDGQPCTIDACDGAGSCAHTATPDTDGDGECDALDPCTNVGGSQDFRSPPRSKVLLSRINTDPRPNDDRIALGGFFRLPVGSAFADLKPDQHGARLAIDANGGAHRVDATLPGGSYGGAGTRGWKRSASGKTWTFLDNTGAPVQGVVKMLVVSQDRPTSPRQVKVVLTGRNSTYPVVTSDAPIKAVVTLGNQTDATAGLCGESTFGQADCVFNRSGNSLRCKR